MQKNRDPDRILLFPIVVFKDYITNMHQTKGKHWHVRTYWVKDKVLLDQSGKEPRIDISKYLISPGQDRCGGPASPGQ